MGKGNQILVNTKGKDIAVDEITFSSSHKLTTQTKEHNQNFTKLINPHLITITNISMVKTIKDWDP
jgi:hypothetical protein